MYKVMHVSLRETKQNNKKAEKFLFFLEECKRKGYELQTWLPKIPVNDF